MAYTPSALTLNTNRQNTHTQNTHNQNTGIQLTYPLHFTYQIYAPNWRVNWVCVSCSDLTGMFCKRYLYTIRFLLCEYPFSLKIRQSSILFIFSFIYPSENQTQSTAHAPPRPPAAFALAMSALISGSGRPLSDGRPMYFVSARYLRYRPTSSLDTP